MTTARRQVKAQWRAPSAQAVTRRPRRGDRRPRAARVRSADRCPSRQAVPFGIPAGVRSRAGGSATPVARRVRSDCATAWVRSCARVTRPAGASGSLGLRGAWVRSRAGGSERLLRVGFARTEHGTPAPIGPRRAHDTAPADHGALLSWNVHGRGGHAAAGARQCSRLWECIQPGGPSTIARPSEHARVAPLVVQKMTAGLAAQLKTGQLPIAEPDMGQELNCGAEQL